MKTVDRLPSYVPPPPQQDWRADPPWAPWGDSLEVLGAIYAVNRRSSIVDLMFSEAHRSTVYGRSYSAAPPRYQGLASAEKAQFDELADQWEEETQFESVVTRAAMHPAYQRIIGMGGQAVPWILGRLSREPRQWFWALTAITGEDPAFGCDSAEDAARAWLEWAEERLPLLALAP